MDNDNAILLDGKRLRRLREQRKLTQLYLATVIEVSSETISRWENNRSPTVKRDNALKLAEVLEVPLEELVKSADVSSVEFSSLAGEQGGLESTPPPGVLRRRFLWQRWAATAAGLLVLLTLSLSWRLWSNSTPFTVSALRHLPRHCLPEQPFPIIIRLAAAPKTGSFMLRENLPDKCILLASYPTSVNSHQTSPQLKWVVQAEQQPLTVVYLIQPQQMHPGEQILFSGSVVAGRRGSQEPPIEGEGVIEVSLFHWADENRDNRIDDYEMLSAYDLFPDGIRPGIDMEEIKAIWAGRGYRWNQAHKKLEIF